MRKDEKKIIKVERKTMLKSLIDVWRSLKKEAKKCLVPMMAELGSDPEDCTGALLRGSLERKC